jgi:DNA-binding FadR family transcriptional regulator
MFRAALEAFTAELAAGRQKRGELAPSQILTLQRLRDQVERSPDAGETARSNLRLHRFVAELSGNSFAIEALSRVWDVISISSRENISDADWRKTIDRHHAEITSAIEAGDELNAASAARHHILAAAETFLRHAAEDQPS